jgi:hypothetical protein
MSAPLPQDFREEAFGGDNIRDYLNRRNERSVASFDTPHNLAINSVYELPFGLRKKFANQSRILGAVVGGWQLNGIGTFEATPLGVSTAVNNLFNYGGVQRPNSNGQDPSIQGPHLPAAETVFQPFCFHPAGALYLR